MSADWPPLDLGVIEAGRQARERAEVRGRRAAFAVSAAITVVWAIYVTASGQWSRVTDNAAAGVTMLFGSFVAGSTPQGGGAVAFPVFTKILEVPAEVARTFSLAIQTVGMGAASLAIVLNRRRVEWRVVAIAAPVAMLSFLGAVALLGDGGVPFRPSTIPGPYIKVSFTLIVGAMALITYLGSRVRIRKVNLEVAVLNGRVVTAIVVTSVIGGVASALTGSGADVLVYLAIAVLLAVDPKVGVPSSVLVMAAVSVVGFIALGVVDGQLDVALSPDGSSVVSVGGAAVGAVSGTGPHEQAFVSGGAPLDAGRFDVFGLWLAAVPVVGWGAPLGSWAASRLRTRQLVLFVAMLAAAEIITTLIFVDALRSDWALAVYGGLGTLMVGGALWWVAANRSRIMGFAAVHPDATLTRTDLDVAPDYRDDLERGEGRG